MEAPIIEQSVIYLSHILSLWLTIYVWVKIDKKLSLLFLVSFVLIYHQFYLLDFIMSIDERTQDLGECLTENQGYYSCMSIYDRISIHAGQFGMILVVLCTILLAKEAAKKNDI